MRGLHREKGKQIIGLPHMNTCARFVRKRRLHISLVGLKGIVTFFGGRGAWRDEDRPLLGRFD